MLKVSQFDEFDCVGCVDTAFGADLPRGNDAVSGADPVRGVDTAPGVDSVRGVDTTSGAHTSRSEAAWESLVSSSETSGVMQSLPWARFKRKQGLDYLHLVLHDETKLLGGGIFYVAPNAKGAGLLVCPEGPVLPWSDNELGEKAFSLLLKALASHAPGMQAMAVRFEPRLESAPTWAFRGFGRAPFDLIPRETLYINLTLSESELLASMQPKGRYNIRLAQRHGVKVEEETFSGGAVHKLHAILTQTSRRDHFLLEPLSFFSDLAENLCSAGVAKLFFAEHEGETLGALVLLTYGLRATYLYGGTGNTKREMMAGYALQWAAMQAAQRAGCTIYDMYGYDQFSSPQNQYAKFSRFKKQFGGQVKRFIGAQDCFFVDRLADVVIKAFAEIEPSEI